MSNTEELELMIDFWRSQVREKTWSWVLFSNGTCVVIKDADKNIRNNAKEILKNFGPVIPGTDLADFSVEEVDLEPGWLVTYSHPDIANFVSINEFAENSEECDEISEKTFVGLVGRKKRVEDAKTLKIIHIEKNFL